MTKREAPRRKIGPGTRRRIPCSPKLWLLYQRIKREASDPRVTVRLMHNRCFRPPRNKWVSVSTHLSGAPIHSEEDWIIRAHRYTTAGLNASDERYEYYAQEYHRRAEAARKGWRTRRARQAT